MVEGDIQEPKEASKKRLSLQAISSITEKRYAAPPLDVTCCQVW